MSETSKRDWVELPETPLRTGSDGKRRCWWCVGDPEYVAYHDTEWGQPQLEDRRLFEKICLEGFQAGLSWLTILRKRANFRAAFADFEVEAVARFDRRKVARLVTDAGIVRHRGKIESAINNAKRALELQQEFGSLADFAWQYHGSSGIREDRLASQTELSRTLSRELKKRGWTFVGPTTMYAFMQSVGLVNDHVPGCSLRRHAESARRQALAQLGNTS